MSENPINITTLNDMIFCPASVYFHQLDADTDKIMYQSRYQINGTAAHKAVDQGSYSSKSDVWQGVEVYCEKYDLVGKIDVFDRENGVLVERKKKISTVFDGYIFQIYAQYFALTEMGETVKRLELYSMDDHKKYPVPMPEQNLPMLEKFEATLGSVKTFSFEEFHQDNPAKCAKCIYNPLCSFACTREVQL